MRYFFSSSGTLILALLRVSTALMPWEFNSAYFRVIGYVCGVFMYQMNLLGEAGDEVYRFSASLACSEAPWAMSSMVADISSIVAFIPGVGVEYFRSLHQFQ